MKQTFCAALLSVALPVLAMSQDGPAIQLKGSIVCRGNSNDAVGCVMPPHQTRAPAPMYPEKERKARHQGVVTLGVVVGSDGVPRDISVLSTLGPDFDKAAIDAVKQWNFLPRNEGWQARGR